MTGSVQVTQASEFVGVTARKSESKKWMQDVGKRGKMGYKSGEQGQEYVAPVIGNGKIVLQVDYEGCMKQQRRSEKIHHNPSLKIWKAGRRNAEGALLRFGYFDQKMEIEEGRAELRSYSQELEIESAIVKTECTYGDRCSVFSLAAVHPEYDLIMINKRICVSEDCRYVFSYNLEEQEDFWQRSYTIGEDGSIVVSYSAVKNQRGILYLFSDAPSFGDSNQNVYSLVFNLKKRCT